MSSLTLSASSISSSVPSSNSSQTSRSTRFQLSRPSILHPGEGCRLTSSDGFLHVTPYDFEFSSYSKTRWFGRSLIEVLTKEFSLSHNENPREYFLKAIESGRIKVNQQITQADYRLTPQDLVTHSVHRHEPPVSNQPILVISESENLLAVCKPASIPIHSCGKYWHLSLLGILLHLGHGRLYCVHRLDRLTSGLVILAKSPLVANKLSEKIKTHKMEKIYLARIMGEFPCEQNILVDAPIKCTSKQKGAHAVNADGKHAVTEFRRLSSDGLTSLVECRPLTGKTHQIRIHLQHLGYPIANDPLYGGKLYESNTCRPLQHPEPGQIAPGCGDCQMNAFYSGDQRYPSHLWLHALKYSTLDQDGNPDNSSPYAFSFETDPPEWAKEGFDSRAALANPLPEHLLPKVRMFESYEEAQSTQTKKNKKSQNENNETNNHENEEKK
jgi:RluA family pseudouridine synthase